MKFKTGDLVMLIATDSLAPFRIGMIGPVGLLGCKCVPRCEDEIVRYVVDFPHHPACCAQRALMKVGGGEAICAADRTKNRLV